MNILLIVILFLVLFVYSLKETFGTFRQIVIWAAVCALSVLVFGNEAISLSKSEIAAWLADKSLMKDIGVLVSLEVIANIAFCVTLVVIGNAAPVSRKSVVLNTVLKYFPGICIFPALFYLLTLTIFALPGVDFDLIKYSFSMVVFVCLPLFSFFVKFILPEKEIRTEILFISSAVLAMAATLLSMG